MSMVGQSRRLAALEARTQRETLAPLIAFIAERHGVTEAEIITEASRIVRLSAGMTERQGREWLAGETGATLETIEASLAEGEAAFAAWHLERGRS